jgi:subtilisin family serine protease
MPKETRDRRALSSAPDVPPRNKDVSPQGPRGERELIVITKPEAGLRATSEGVTSTLRADVGPLADLLASAEITLQPLFGVSEDRLKFEATSRTPAFEDGVEPPDLSVFYRVAAPEERLDELAEQLRQQPLVEAAYVKPPAELARAREYEAAVALGEDINTMQPLIQDAPPATPDFTGRQGYLDVAPGGIDARHAWTLPGGFGAGVRVIDLEWGWRFSHEDLLQNQGGIVGGTGSTDTNHGTAVAGEISGDRNSIGITGIAPDAHISAVAFSMPTAAARWGLTGLPRRG